mmetsp:Transcript_50246/g.132819  ORF Transcript_50246/g.132819 Transcript_50246/m.132819 type:complete len:713 (+) Transcript_50246:72-2210(+)
MAPPARWRGSGLVACFALLAAAALPTASGADPSSPISKVVELLRVLGKQLEGDGRVDAGQYKKYDKWYQGASAEAKRVISQTTSKIAELSSSLEEQDAFRTKATQQFEKASNALGKLENEYNEAKGRREAERKTFEKNEGEFMRGVDTLERSVAVLKKKMPKSAALLAESEAASDDSQDASDPAAPKHSLISIAKGLRSMFEGSKDFTLSTSQQDSVDGFVRLAAEGAAVTPEASTLALLQVDERDDADQSAPSYGDFESQSGGILATLASVLGKTKKQLSDNQSDEAKNAKEYKKLVAAMEKETKSLEKAISEIRNQISQSQEKTGQMKAQLLAAKELLKVTTEQKATVQEEYTVKTRNYKERVARRTDEQLAVKEALQILMSDDMKKLMAKKSASYVQYVALPRRDPSAEAGAPSRRASPAEENDDSAESLSFLSLRSRTHSRLRTRNDPFGKVKSLVRSMLRKLSDEQAKDEKHAAWCDSEMAKSTQSKEFKENNVQKLKDRIEEMDAEIAQLTDDLKATSEDLAEIKKTTAEATKVRVSEVKRTKEALAQYKDAQRLLGSAIKVLQRVYAKDNSVSKESSQRGDVGSGVVGLLELAADNYAKLEQELTISEGVAQKDYKKLMDESEVRLAVFNKDLEYKSRSKTKLNGDRMRATTDLKSYQKELSAVLAYLAELKSACVKKDTYEDRAARRENELKGLKEALDYMNRG